MSLILGLAIFISCEDDEVIPDAPTVVAPSGANSIQEGSSVDLTFNITVPGGYKSATINASGGTATITSQLTAEATSGEVVVSFTAGSTAGAASVTLTVTDLNNLLDDATAVLTVEEEPTVFTISSNITTNTTWKTGKTYILASRIAVVDGVTLTIEPGVVVKGEAGSAANATALLIARGGRLMAEGTASSPIIFTSTADQIQPGSIASPNMDPALDGLWGGLIILGKAPISPKGSAEAFQIEGIPTSDPNGLYGGTVANDNSGSIKYISIRHGGTNIGEGNEINGLTLGGVGSGTTIENVEVIANQDDGIEFFGGTVSVKNALVWNNGDDALDTDQAYAGTVDNFVIINPGDKAFELDGPEGSYTSTGHTLTNGTVYMGSCGGGYDDDGSTDAIVTNVYFTDFTEDTGKENDYNENGSFINSNLQMDGSYTDGDNNVVNITVAEYFGDMDGKVDGSGNPVMSIVTNATVGADLTKFSDWTWAAVAGKLN